jgi:hypothetical protein
MNPTCKKIRRLNFVKVLLPALMLVLLGGTASANTWTPNAPIAGIGSANNYTYFRMGTALPTGCGWSVMFIQDTGGWTEPVSISRGLSVAMAAYMGGKPIKRIDYNQVVDKCYITLIEF